MFADSNSIVQRPVVQPLRITFRATANGYPKHISPERTTFRGGRSATGMHRPFRTIPSMHPYRWLKHTGYTPFPLWGIKL